MLSCVLIWCPGVPRPGTVWQCGKEREREKEVKGDEECPLAHPFKLVINYFDRNISRDTPLAIHKHRVCDCSKEN